MDFALNLLTHSLTSFFTSKFKEKETCEHVREEYCYEGGKLRRIILFTI